MGEYKAPAMTNTGFYITTPIYYVNDSPHLGTAYTSIISDIFNRYNKLLGRETFFLTGLDEHGQKCQQAAETLGKHPQEHCDEMSRIYKKTWKALNIQYDLFFRTTHRYDASLHKKDHTAVVQTVLQKLKDQGDIYEGLYKGWYSISEEIFYKEKELVDGKSPSGREVIPIEEKNYFFKMSKYQERLKKYLDEHPSFILPFWRQNELKGFLKKPLHDLCISRPKKRVSWGVELPFDSDYVAYVWVDALLNYITGVGFGGEEREDILDFEKWWIQTGAVHFIGKDILTTHGIYWPCLLMALELPLPKTIFAHGWLLNKEQEKMSKSRGDVLNPMELAEELGVDGLRYFLAREIPLGNDAAISKDMMKLRIHQDLSHSVGNILSRLTHLVEKHFEGFVPSETPPQKDSDFREAEELQQKLIHMTEELLLGFKSRIENFQLSQTLEAVQNLLKEVNVYLEKTKPWKTVKTHKEEAGRVLYTSLEVLRICGILLSPVMPDKMNLLLRTLKSEASFENLKWGGLKEGQSLKTIPSLFPKF